MTPRDALDYARWRARTVAPYLGRGLFAMSFIETPEVPTIGIDREWRVYYNPGYVLKCAADKTLVGEILHECGHRTMRHGERARTIGATDKERFNRAADLEDDQRIEELRAMLVARAGNPNVAVKLVTDRVTCANCNVPRGLTMEEYYVALAKGLGHTGKCGGGSGVTGQKESWEKPGTVKGLSEAQAKILSQQIAQDIIDAATKRPGSVPAGLLRWAELYADLTPIPWEDLAQSRVAYALESRRGSHPSYKRRSRRRMGRFVLPVHRIAQQTACVLCDTSGSMGQTATGKALAVVHDACQAFAQRVFAVSCDTAATEPVEIGHVDDLKWFYRGGGGTDMVAGIDKALECTPDVLVVVTDGGTPWPTEKPEVPVVVVLTEPSGGVPAWADIIHAY